MLARVVAFEGVGRERMAELTREMEAGERPADIPATEVVVLYDREAETSLVIFFFDSEEDYARADEALNAMPPDDTPGARASVTKYEVASRVTM